ncbi:MAG TPA: ABC-2 family transporter protein [Bacillota bacterium]|nr:ABC-2 family transporter protein [Bacillota bacterium]
MNYFVAILKKTFKIVVSYKWHFIINLLINPIIIFTFISLFKTIYTYDSNQIIVGYTCTQMIWYFAAITFFYCFVWCEPDKEVSAEIISGTMALRLTKPISIMKTTFLNAAAFQVFNIIFSFLPTFILYSLFVYPDFFSLTAFIKYLALNFLAFVLLYLISFFIGSAAFKLQSITALQSVKATFILMAGVYLPFDFLPGILQSIVKALPFQYIYYVPIQFFLNKPETRSPEYFWTTVLAVTFWIIVFYFLSVVAWRIAIKKFHAVGG